jgi:hypothetical protein
VGEGDPGAVYSVTFAPADGGYVAYDLRAERAVGIQFDTTGLTLTRNGATVRAERL